MSIDEFCGIAVAASLLMLIGMFVALVSKINHPPKRKSIARAEAQALR